MGNDDLFDNSKLDAMTSNPVSSQIDDVFKKAIKEKTKVISKSEWNGFSAPEEALLNDEGELEIGVEAESSSSQVSTSSEDGFDLNFNENENLDLVEVGEQKIETIEKEDLFGDLSISLDNSEDKNISLSKPGEEESFDVGPDNLDLDFNKISEVISSESEDEVLILDENQNDVDDIPDLGDSNPIEDNFSENVEFLVDEELKNVESTPKVDLDTQEEKKSDDLEFSFNSNLEQNQNEDLSDDAKKKLEEIDEILIEDATRFKLGQESEIVDDQKLYPQDKEEVSLKKDINAKINTLDKSAARELKDISIAYTGEIERIQATISNLRSDREELLMKIQKLEEEKILQSRQILSQRAELDERKIELTIIRKKMNEEISNLKDLNVLHEEKKLILEEKNRMLHLELDKAKQKNKIDVKNIQMRERELEQKLELLKSDAEMQIKNRDLKILELKRRIDTIEFDLESISSQEKKSIESRYELEDKLNRAIKTLRGAISALEDEGDRSDALNALKKNIDV